MHRSSLTFILFFFCISLFTPFSFTVHAQTVSCAGLSGTQLTQCQASAQARARFNPNASIQGGNTFGGIQFSGVGGALAGCTNVGGMISGGISGGINALGSALGIKGQLSTSVAVNDPKNDQRQNCLNGVAYAVAKGLLQQVTNKTLNFINTGLNGNKTYVSDIDSLLKTISDQQINRFLQEIPSKNPIFGNAIRSIVTQQATGIQDGLLESVMNTPEAREYQAFQEDFTNGGWEAFLNPKNDVVDATFHAFDELSHDIGTNQDNIQNEIERNEGFLDLKKCVEYKRQDTIYDYCNELSPDERRYYRCPSDAEIAAAQNDPGECVRWETVTPGSIIQERAATVINSDIRQLEQADQINEVLGAFFDQLLNRIFSFGLSGAGSRTGTQWGFGGFGNNVVLGTNGLPLAGANSAGTVGGSGYVTADFDISRPQHLRAVLQAQYDYLNRVQDTHSALGRIVPTLGALDYCIPGPNPTWKEGLNDNAETYFGSLQEVPEGARTVGQVLQSVPIVGGFFGGGESHTIAAVNVGLYDKASGQTVQITNTAFYERNRSTLAIFENVQRRYNEVLDYYEANYTKDTVKNAFIAADPGNSAFAAGFVEDAFLETAKLPSYNQNINESGLEAEYSDSETSTREAIRELESIRSEVNGIVLGAKNRYIAERIAAGNPINRTCLDQAYVIDTSAITPVARQESGTTSPFAAPSAEANTYFYTQL